MTDLTREEYHKQMQRERAKLKSVPASPEKPRRTTVSEMAMALATRTGRDTEGVELTWNAKGDVQAKIDTTVHEGEALHDATLRALAELAFIQKAHPRMTNEEPAPRRTTVIVRPKAKAKSSRGDS